jgi:hypothetical protein
VPVTQEYYAYVSRNLQVVSKNDIFPTQFELLCLGLVVQRALSGNCYWLSSSTQNTRSIRILIVGTGNNQLASKVSPSLYPHCTFLYFCTPSVPHRCQWPVAHCIGSATIQVVSLLEIVPFAGPEATSNSDKNLFSFPGLSHFV